MKPPKIPETFWRSAGAVSRSFGAASGGCPLGCPILGLALFGAAGPRSNLTEVAILRPNATSNQRCSLEKPLDPGERWKPETRILPFADSREAQRDRVEGSIEGMGEAARDLTDHLDHYLYGTQYDEARIRRCRVLDRVRPSQRSL